MLKTIVVASTVLAVAAIASIAPVSAATVRRHLHCSIVPMLSTQNLGQFTLQLIAINNWSFTIPKGTKYTYSVAGGRSYSKTVNQSLAPNASVMLATVGSGTTCDVSVPS